MEDAAEATSATDSVPRVFVEVADAGDGVARAAATALLDLALVETGVVVSEFELAEMSLGQLVDVLTVAGPLRWMRLDRSGGHHQLTLVGTHRPDRARRRADQPIVSEERRRDIDLGLRSWALDGVRATIHVGDAGPALPSTVDRDHPPPTRGTTPPRLRILMSNDLEMIAFARQVLRRTLPPLDEDRSSLVLGAASELMTNAIQEHQRSKVDRDVEIDVEVDSATVAICDHGRGLPEGELPAGAGGGLGLVIAKSVLDDLRFASGPAGTIATFTYGNEGARAIEEG